MNSEYLIEYIEYNGWEIETWRNGYFIKCAKLLEQAKLLQKIVAGMQELLPQKGAEGIHTTDSIVSTLRGVYTIKIKPMSNDIKEKRVEKYYDAFETSYKCWSLFFNYNRDTMPHYEEMIKLQFTHNMTETEINKCVEKNFEKIFQLMYKKFGA